MSEYPSSLVDLMIERVCAQARESFADFRRLMHPGMMWNWWLTELAEELQQFWEDLKAGRRPKLAIMAPPQHGKSWLVTDFAAWSAGKNPDYKTVFASFSDDLGVRTNLDLQRSIRNPRYAATFAGTWIGKPGWQCNSSLVEYVDHGGSFRNTTIKGAVNGMELHFGIIDDPHKGRDAADSKLVRDQAWTWFLDDFMSRFSANAGLLMTMTRWHQDDLLGRAIERFPDLRVLRYPAIAEHDMPHRCKGGALFPELKPLDFLLRRKETMGRSSWESLYQQNPIIVGGGEFPLDKLRILQRFDRGQITHSVRYWDKGGSEAQDAAFTAGVLMHRMLDGTFVIGDIVRGRWMAFEREQRIKEIAEVDSKFCLSLEIVVEQEPGTGGMESAQNTIRNLMGYRVSADRVTGSKELRAQPFAAQVQAGNIYLAPAEWNGRFCDECEAWPYGPYKDQIDAAAGAYSKLTTGSCYNTNYAQWV